MSKCYLCATCFYDLHKMRKIDRRIVIVISVAFILLVAYGLMRFLIAQKEPPPAHRFVEARRFVKTAPILYGSMASPVSAPGRLSSVSEVDIVAEASGRIEAGNRSLKKGSCFKKGDKLFVIYPDEAILSLKARKSQYQNILANILPDLAIDYPEHEEAFNKFFTSIKVDRPLPPIPEIKDNQLKIFLASRNVISEYYNIQRDELQLERRTVRAPFNGTYKEVYMELGAFTNTGGRVARAIRTDELELEVPLERSDAEWVKLGDPVIVTSEKRSLTWQGKVIRKGQFVDENTQSQTIFIRIPNNSKQPLLTGEYLVADFPGRPIEGVMEMPRNAVFNTDEVFIVRSGRLAKEKIHIVKVNESTLLFNGPSEGDTLVLQQLINVAEGTLVQINKSQPDQRRGKRPDPYPGSEARKQEKPEKKGQRKTE